MSTNQENHRIYKFISNGTFPDSSMLLNGKIFDNEIASSKEDGGLSAD